MKQDPFGNLMDWGQALNTIEELSEQGKFGECQHGLTRILRYRGNWRLREEVLKRIAEIETPSEELIFQVVAILSDDNIYYDARIIACDSLVQLLEEGQYSLAGESRYRIGKAVEKLRSVPQPIYFEKALNRLNMKLS